MIAIITARIGSKGLPKKNILDLNGHPLLAWTIFAAKKSKVIKNVYVTTESEDIADIARKYGANVIERPVELATDNASSESVIGHAIDAINIKNEDIILLQPTSPLRDETHIDEAARVYYLNKANCVISVFEPSSTPIKSYVQQSNGTIEGLYSKSAPYCRRQDLPKAYQPNGAIYIFSAQAFKDSDTFPKDNVYPYVMQQHESLDIDVLEDLIKVREILKGKKND